MRDENLATRWRRPHLRAPGYPLFIVKHQFLKKELKNKRYIFGAVGKVVQYTGTFHNPERVAFQQQGPKQPLYTVRFSQKDLWDLYDGHHDDTVDVGILIYLPFFL